MKKIKISMLFSSMLLSAGVLSNELVFNAIVGLEEGSIAKKIGYVYKNISSWSDVGNEYNCLVWTPEDSTKDYGVTFEQSQDCSQNQERTKDQYSVYSTGIEVYEKTITESQVSIKTKTRDSIGTKNIITGTISETTNWSNSGSSYNCTSWSPATSTITSGQSFTQERMCSQNQTQTTKIYNVWSDGAQTLQSTTTSNRVETQKETRSATGTKVNYGSWVTVGNTTAQTAMIMSKAEEWMQMPFSSFNMSSGHSCKTYNGQSRCLSMNNIGSPKSNCKKGDRFMNYNIQGPYAQGTWSECR